MPRRQCKHCPWKVGTDPREIPGGYSEEMHRRLTITISDGAGSFGNNHVMACHETVTSKELHCVGWLVNQLGPGNNLGLRLKVMTGQIDANVEAVGPQHERLEDTFPRD